MCILNFFIRTTRPANHILPNLRTLTVLDWEHELWNSPLCNFVQLLRLSHVQGQYFWMVLSWTPPVCVLISRDATSHTAENGKKFWPSVVFCERGRSKDCEVNCGQHFWKKQTFWHISFSLCINTIEYHTSFIVLLIQFLHTTRPTLLEPSTPSSPFTSFPDTSTPVWKSFLPTLWK